MQLLTKISDIRGALIVYLGGTSLSVYGFSANAVEAAKAVAHNVISSTVETAGQVPPESFVNKFVAVAGIIFVAGRLAFDIFKYIDQRRLIAYEEYLRRKRSEER